MFTLSYTYNLDDDLISDKDVKFLSSGNNRIYYKGKLNRRGRNIKKLHERKVLKTIEKSYDAFILSRMIDDAKKLNADSRNNTN